MVCLDEAAHATYSLEDVRGVIGTPQPWPRGAQKPQERSDL